MMNPKTRPREIAAHLRAVAHQYQPLPAAHWLGKPGQPRNWPPVAEFAFGTFKVRCYATEPDILACAKRFDLAAWPTRLGPGYRNPRPPSLKRPADADQRQAELIAECGTIDQETPAIA